MKLLLGLIVFGTLSSAHAGDYKTKCIQFPNKESSVAGTYIATLISANSVAGYETLITHSISPAQSFPGDTDLMICVTSGK